MRPSTLIWRSLRYHARTNAAVMLGVAVGTAVLSGALLVGDSMRASLRENALARLGRVEQAVIGTRFFPASVAERLKPRVGGQRVEPLIALSGAATQAESRRRAGGVSVLGVGAEFPAAVFGEAAFGAEFGGRVAILNRRLADELRAAAGDDVLVRLGRPAAVSAETLLGRRDQQTVTLRLRVVKVIPQSGAGGFSLAPQSLPPASAFIPLDTLQAALGQSERVNTLLLCGREGSAPGGPETERVREAVAQVARLEDFGVRLRTGPTPLPESPDTSQPAGAYVAVESDSVLLDPPIEQAAEALAAEWRGGTQRVLAYLANRIERIAGEDAATRPSAAAVPYSTAVAIDEAAELRLVDGSPAPRPAAGEILINGWTAQQLGAAVGESLRITYYVTGAFGELETHERVLTLRGIVRMDAAAADAGFVPEYPGITDSPRISDWDPPFPVDLGQIRDVDEQYWEQYRTAPKAFLALREGQALWADRAEQIGRLTSVRFYARGGEPLDAVRAHVAAGLLRRLAPEAAGLRVEPVRARAEEASGGSTDFGGLFIGFSLFLIGSAGMLVALLFRLGVERRASQIGLLLACGINQASVRRLLLAEGTIVAAVGALLGTGGAIVYAAVMIHGLRTWWAEAATAPFLSLHVSGESLAIGYVAALLLGLGSIALALRGITRLSARALLSGSVAATRLTGRGGRSRAAQAAGLAALLVAAVCLAASAFLGSTAAAAAFFGGAVALLVAGLAGLRIMLDEEPRTAVTRPGGMALVRMGARNVQRHAGRSLLTAGLIASASFLIVAVGAFRLEAPGDATRPDSGTGGFVLIGQAATPVLQDLNTPAGREALSLSDEARAMLDEAEVIALRRSGGDETSCLNLYRPTQPAILGATRAMIERGGFVFARSRARSAEERANPWALLELRFDDGAIPVIGDEASVMWQLHKGLGQDLVIRDGRGRDATLRFVALLRGSVLQSELIVSEQNFTRLFPRISGYGTFLIACKPDAAGAIETSLERDLEPYGLDLGSTLDRLRAYSAVQNTYLSAFQSLGGLGLVLGTIGLAAVVLRSVWERRAELALLQALGYSRAAVEVLVLSEHALLVVIGLVLGIGPAILATLPQLADRPEAFPWSGLAVTLVGVLVVGMAAAALAVLASLRERLLGSLRAE